MEETNFRKAYVFVQDVYAGVISETDNGYSFLYDSDYAEKKGPAVSLTLPVQSEPFESRSLFPFFDGLIPEGWLLNVAERNWKISHKDRFGLLLAVCKDSIGDVSVRTEKGSL